jgi:hypothetical protein
MLTGPVAGEGFKAVAGRDAEIVEGFGGFEATEHDTGAVGDIGGDAPGSVALGGRFRVFVAITQNHVVRIRRGAFVQLQQHERFISIVTFKKMH